jgi:hypothetical protein
MPLPLKA